MSVILKYVIDFPSAGFTVSNDLLKGDFIIDVYVKASMMRDAAGGYFEVKLYDLPEKKSDELKKKVLTPKQAKVVIKLGYMDGEFDTVMEGTYYEATVRVEGDSLVTTIKGQESGTYALLHTRFQKGLDGVVSLTDAVTGLLKEAIPEIAAPSQASGLAAAVASLLGDGGSSGSDLDQAPRVENISSQVQDIALRGENLMEILQDLAKMANAEFLVSDKKVRIGKPITDDDYPPDEFDLDVNLAVFRAFAKSLPTEEGTNRVEKLEAEEAIGFQFVIAGDPKLRPAQQVFANLNGYRKKDTADFRIHSLEHILSMSGGYTCTGTAMKVCKDDNCHRLQKALNQGTPDAVIQGFSQRIKDEPRRRPTVEVGNVKSYKPGEAGAAPHRTTLYFGQRFTDAETQPSMRAEVETKDNQLLRNKPIVSSFAWHKCGLVVPVYPGMKALLSHNLNLPDDALVTGFLWSEKPTLEPPKNKEGDWWLCLPIDFDTSSPPSDSTKAANDLIANNGKRVIEVKGLRISVGADALGNVGTRPQEGNDDEFLIEHASGAKILIKNGEIQLTDGSVTLKISNGMISVS